MAINYKNQYLGISGSNKICKSLILMKEMKPLLLFPTKPPSEAVHFYFLTNGFLSLFKIIRAFGQ